GYSLRAERANIPLGDAMHAVFSAHGIEAPKVAPVVTVFHNDNPVSTITMSPLNDSEPPEY
ncbi:hypothetical protein, partial [Streptococcus pneumoniae]|uniref:hypothetical protein n=1 Tax=Streptococcus pneumoniae TaxID=1313 RepID=UPI001E5D5ED0